MKYWQYLGAIILALFSLFFLMGCTTEERTITKVELDPNISLEDIDLNDFELSDLMLIITFSDETTETVQVIESMLSTEDIAKLSFMGTHTLTINYLTFTVTLNLSLTDTVTLNNLLSFYQFSVESLGYLGSYETWVGQFTIGTNKTIISASLNNLNQMIITLSTQEVINLGEMSALVYTVTFYNYYGEVIAVHSIPKGGSATPPIAAYIEDHNFVGWSGPYQNIQFDIDLFAMYEQTYVPITGIDDADELIISLTRLEEAQFGVNLDSIFSSESSTQSEKRSRTLSSIYSEALAIDTSDGFDPDDFIPHNYWQHMFYHQGLYQETPVVDGFHVITSTLTSYSAHALNNLYEVNTQVTDHARERADWA
ncbi:MAG: hypothetical protein KKH92_02970, partial [Firmicutes bacterium]|nr:hypothetical protein [Bacillota bacterium]